MPLPYIKFVKDTFFGQKPLLSFYLIKGALFGYCIDIAKKIDNVIILLKQAQVIPS